MHCGAITKVLKEVIVVKNFYSAAVMFLIFNKKNHRYQRDRLIFSTLIILNFGLLMISFLR
jgi:hypothetical protein